jgi:hypothetical protein
MPCSEWLIRDSLAEIFPFAGCPTRPTRRFLNLATQRAGHPATKSRVSALRTASQSCNGPVGETMRRWHADDKWQAPKQNGSRLRPSTA